MQDVMFQTLSDILALDSEISHGAALHGLGHLHHPATHDLVTEFIRQHPTLRDERRTMLLPPPALRCSAGSARLPCCLGPVDSLTSRPSALPAS